GQRERHLPLVARQGLAQAREGRQRQAASELAPGRNHAPSVQYLGHVCGHKPRNVRPRTPCCQTAAIGQILVGTGICHRRAASSDWASTPEAPGVIPILLLILLAALLAWWWLARRRRHGHRRHTRAMAGVLDAADALESRLRTARSEIEAVAGEGPDPVRDALQEMLRQRLWLQQHGAAASAAELDAVRDSIDGARVRIDQQLTRIEQARAGQP